MRREYEIQARDRGRGCVRTVGRSAEARRTPCTVRRTVKPSRQFVFDDKEDIQEVRQGFNASIYENFGKGFLRGN